MSILIIYTTWDLIKNLKIILETKMIECVKFNEQNISKLLSLKTKKINY